MVHSLSKQGSKRLRCHGEDTGNASQQQNQQRGMTQEANVPNSSLTHQPRHSNRTGAGTRGHISQLEQVGAVVEGLQHGSRPRTTLPDDLAQNPIPPGCPQSWKKVIGYICTSTTFTSQSFFQRPPQMAPSPYVPTAGVNPALSSQPHFHPSTDSNHFGFYEPPHLIPPGTEPDLQALNNPYITTQCEKENQLAASQAPHSTSTSSWSDFAHQPPPSLNSQASSSHTGPQNFFLPDQIDPFL